MDAPPIPVTNREVLLMAYSVAEWASALAHLRALQEVGCRMPEGVLVGVQTELHSFAAIWAATWDLSRWTVEEVVARCRSWLAEHQDELDHLLSERAEV